MNVSEIKDAVEAGENVFWSNSNYKVIKDSIGQYLIHSQCNDHYVGLTWQDGITLNGEEVDFFTKADEISLETLVDGYGFIACRYCRGSHYKTLFRGVDVWVSKPNEPGLPTHFPVGVTLWSGGKNNTENMESLVAANWVEIDAIFDKIPYPEQCQYLKDDYLSDFYVAPITGLGGVSFHVERARLGFEETVYYAAFEDEEDANQWAGICNGTIATIFVA